MKGVIPLLLCLALSTECFAQASAVALKSASFAAHMAHNYRQAGELFEQALRLPSGQASAGEYFNAACSWAMAGESANAFRNLELATKMGWDNLAQLKTDTDLLSLHTDKRWREMVAKAESTVALAEAGQNLALKQELLTMYESDQGPRRAIGPIQQRYGPSSPQLDSLYRDMRQQDMHNESRLQQIIEQYGWPGAALVGRSGSNAAFLVIQHADLVAIQKYLPLIRKETAKGGLPKQSLALMEDRVLIYQNKPQIYGSQVRTDAASGKSVLYPIADEARVDERRTQMGLEPLADYAKRFGIIYFPGK